MFGEVVVIIHLMQVKIGVIMLILNDKLDDGFGIMLDKN
jgi:hypothetical protein